VVGPPEEVAEELIVWVEDTGVDGFNLAYAVMPETFADFADRVMPELQRRGRYKRDYAPGTLREKLYGQGRARLGADHPAVRFRSMPICRAVDEPGRTASLVCATSFGEFPYVKTLELPPSDCHCERSEAISAAECSNTPMPPPRCAPTKVSAVPSTPSAR
jgi:hypothetical protein